MAAIANMNKNATEGFFNNWNAVFPDSPLTVEDLKKPHSFFRYLFRMFDRLGIDNDAVLMLRRQDLDPLNAKQHPQGSVIAHFGKGCFIAKPPLEKNLNDDVALYWDLLPFINVTRVINHLVSIKPEVTRVTLNHILQPSVSSSTTILLLLFNYLIFNEQQLDSIAEEDKKLFNFANVVKSLEEQRNNLLEQMNTQAVEKGKRSQRMGQYEREIQHLEEELKFEEESHDVEKRELDKAIKENNATDMTLEQKKATKEGLIIERDRKKALRVYDADDIKSQAVQAAQNVQEAEEKLNSLKATIAQKENNLKILQMVKPNLDTANNLLHEITNLKDFHIGDLDEDSKDGELDMLNTDLLELQAQESETCARRAETASRWLDGQAKRQQERMFADNILRDAEKSDKKRREFSSAATQRTQKIMEQTSKYDEEKSRGMNTIQQLKDTFTNGIIQFEDALIKQLTRLAEKMEQESRKLHSL